MDEFARALGETIGADVGKWLAIVMCIIAFHLGASLIISWWTPAKLAFCLELITWSPLLAVLSWVIPHFPDYRQLILASFFSLGIIMGVTVIRHPHAVARAVTRPQEQKDA